MRRKANILVVESSLVHSDKCCVGLANGASRMILVMIVVVISACVSFLVIMTMLTKWYAVSTSIHIGMYACRSYFKVEPTAVCVSYIDETVSIITLVWISI